jgi:uncharacterized damage-inducible protein DinB
MSIAESLLPEFDQEATTTRRLLERVPEDRADWKPHPKSMALGQLAMHLANLYDWGVQTLRETEFDLEPPGAPPYKPRVFESTAALLEEFDTNVREARAALAATSDEDMMVIWSLLKGGQKLFGMPRIACMRMFVLNHIVHHRGQLSVFLRLLDVPLPSIYGPTADEPLGGSQ